MKRYTADTNALLAYLADVLPADAEELFARAERGTAVIEAPAVSFGETFYRLHQGTNVSGVDLTLGPEGAWRALALDGPVNVADLETAGTAELATTAGAYSLHDAMIVAVHHARDTDGIITRDPDFRDSDVPTVW